MSDRATPEELGYRIVHDDDLRDLIALVDDDHRASTSAELVARFLAGERADGRTR